MAGQKNALVVGGTSGLGLGIARLLAARGEKVTITGRDLTRCQAVAAPEGMQAIALDLTQPKTIAESLKGIDRVDHLVIAAIDRDANSIKDYDIDRALNLVTLKLVGYSEVVHQLVGRFGEDASIVMLGGLAKERPYPGSTTVSTVNGGVVGMMRTMVVELAPIRVNNLHPGVIEDTPAWSGKPDAVLGAFRARSPLGRLATTAEVAGACLFLLDNGAVNGVDLIIDGGTLLK